MSWVRLGLMGLLASWVIAAFIFSVAALVATRRLLRRNAKLRETTPEWPGIAILRPCAGLDAELEENLLSTVTARYDGPRELFILVAQESDPAHAIGVAVQGRARVIAPNIPVHLVVTGITTKHNRKVAQMVHAEHMSTAPVVVVIDSDIQLDDETLPGLIGAMQRDPKAGASSCPVIDIRRDTIGDRASAALLTSSPHAFFCLAALAERSRGAHVLCGALIAIRRSVLDELGGFARFERYLGEDFELARLLHERGYSIPTAHAPGRVTDRGRSVASVVQRFARWATVTRQQRPHLLITYFIFLGCAPLLIGFGGVALIAHDRYALPMAAAIMIVVGVRLLLTMTLRGAYGLRDGIVPSLGAMLLGELTVVVGSAGALGRPIVAWRGARYRVQRGGVVELIS